MTALAGTNLGLDGGSGLPTDVPYSPIGGTSPEAPHLSLAFTTLAEIAKGDSTRVELCQLGPTSSKGGEARLVAVKRLRAELAPDAEVARRFFEQMVASGPLRHPNVVEVLGRGSDESGHFLALELVLGVSLARLMRTVADTGEQFPERLVVYIALKICAGLQAIHDLDITGVPGSLVHGDLTPANVLLSFQGDVKIGGMGLAKAKRDLVKTVPGLAVGDSRYLAPEQLRGVPISGRADVFSMGVVLYELFTSRLPWASVSQQDWLANLTTVTPEALMELRPKLHRRLAELTASCLALEPTSRPEAPATVQHELYSWLDAHGHLEGSGDALSRFVKRNSMRQMRWFERAIAGELAAYDPARSPLDAREPHEGTPSYERRRVPGSDARTEGASSESASSIPEQPARRGSAVADEGTDDAPTLVGAVKPPPIAQEDPVPPGAEPILREAARHALVAAELQKELEVLGQALEVKAARVRRALEAARLSQEAVQWARAGDAPKALERLEQACQLAEPKAASTPSAARAPVAEGPRYQGLRPSEASESRPVRIETSQTRLTFGLFVLCLALTGALLAQWFLR